MGQAAYSVKHEPISTVPANREEPPGSGVVAQSPYVDLEVRKLREVTYLKTGQRTRNQNPVSFRAILHRIEGDS